MDSEHHAAPHGGEHPHDDAREPGTDGSSVRNAGRSSGGDERLRLLELAAENAGDVILITEAEPVDGPGGPRVLYVNPAFTRMTGYAPEEIIGGTPRLLQGPDTDPEARRRVRRALRSWEPFREELQNYKKDGTPFWVELDVRPVADETGWFTHWVAVQRDVTSRKEAEAERERARAEAAENEARLSLAMEVAGLGAWDLDFVRHVAVLSPGAMALLGRPTDAPAALGRTAWREWTHPEDQDRVMDELYAACASPSGEYTTEFRVVWPDGSAVRWLRSRGRVLRSPDGTPTRAVGVWRDITADRERDDAEEALRRRQRNFLRQILASVTEGRLRLCGSADDLPCLRGDGPLRCEVPLSAAEDLASVRAAVLRFARGLGMEAARTYDLVLAAGEAAMNAFVHAGGGRVLVRRDEPGHTLQVCVSDRGTGISEADLHRATLERGYSSVGTLGQGFSIITQTVDRVWLLTGPEGTTVVLEQNLRPAESGD